MKLKSRRSISMLPIMIGIIFFLTSCGDTSAGVGVSYKPPFAPIQFTVYADGTISVQGDASVVTPLGTFSVTAQVSTNMQPADNSILLIIRHQENSSTVDTAYQINTQQEVTVVLDGKTTIRVTNKRVLIDASKGDVTNIEVTDARSVNISNNPETNTTPTVENVPTVTPSPPSIPTPLPYLVSKAGDVCRPPYNQFQAAQGWRAENNSLIFSGYGANVVISPCNITTPNYAVTATITLLIPKSSPLGVGVIAHADSGGQTGYAGGAGCKNNAFPKCGFFINDYFASTMLIDKENYSLTGQTHTYKLVVNGVTLQLFYDNNPNPSDTKSSASHLEAGYAGFVCWDQCVVTGFMVTGI